MPSVVLSYLKSCVTSHCSECPPLGNFTQNAHRGLKGLLIEGIEVHYMSDSQTGSRTNDKQEMASSFSFPVLEWPQAQQRLNCLQAHVADLRLRNVFLSQSCLFQLPCFHPQGRVWIYSLCFNWNLNRHFRIFHGNRQQSVWDVFIRRFSITRKRIPGDFCGGG